jgi:hypothetical protein
MVTAPTDRHRVDVYPVGVLADLRHAWRYVTVRRFPAAVGSPPWSWRINRAYTSLRHIRQTVVRHVRDRDWRALKNTFNGYLAEPYHWPEDGSLTRCGSGWTKSRALRSLRRHGWEAR